MKYTFVKLEDTWYCIELLLLADCMHHRKALEACVEKGMCKNIGLSNFNEVLPTPAAAHYSRWIWFQKQISEISAGAKIQPAVLQV